MPKGLKIYLSGLLMGAADVVPGVSGGTIAFILGVYDRLISALSRVNKDSVKMLLKADFKALWLYFDGTFLLLLGSGILTSIFILAGFVTYLLEVYPSYLWSFFFGLILASAKLLINQIQGFNWRHFLIMLLGAGVGMSLSLLVPTQFNTSLSMVFFSGMVAICAMILPGISGSFLLLMMGMYGFILSAIKSFDLLVISIFSAGALIGLLSFSKILNYLLNRARFMTLAALTGVMLGALVKVWPWKVVTEWMLLSDKKIPLEESLVLPWGVPNFHFLTSFAYPVLFISVGFLSVILISYIFLRNSDK
ncbi:DUF368 domain-containing protein [Marinomonas sp. 2405UD66-6]|uniref:DUF368 domain-containing protein n=1 Tax=Marinomonas sp. 2405UD66-6 TaxID=3391834 RepID=UPI0039C8D2BA